MILKWINSNCGKCCFLCGISYIVFRFILNRIQYIYEYDEIDVPKKCDERVIQEQPNREDNLRIYEEKKEKDEFKRKIKEEDLTRSKQNLLENKRNIVTYKPPSLVNSGATCYLNSAFQGISACNTFVSEINKLSSSKNCESLNKLHFFKELIDILNDCSKGRMDISENKIFQHWNKSGQQDSYELLAYALNEVYNELRKHLENTNKIKKRDLNSWLQQELPMRYTILYQIKCGSCFMNSSSPLQSDLAFHVTIPKQQSQLDKLLDLHFAEDLIADYECDQKGCDGKGTKRIARLCRPLPKTICIHLQRTYWNGWKMVKINDKVSFQNYITIKSEFLLKKSNQKQLGNGDSDNEEFSEILLNTFINDIIKHAISKIEEETEYNNNNEESYNSDEIKIIIKSTQNANDQDDYDKVLNKYTGDFDHKDGYMKECNNVMVENQVTEINKDEKYDLVSVIEHSGSVYGGHYICYKKVSDKWFLTNDSYVREVSEADVLRCQAYILFYELPLENGV